MSAFCNLRAEQKIKSRAEMLQMCNLSSRRTIGKAARKHSPFWDRFGTIVAPKKGGASDQHGSTVFDAGSGGRVTSV